MTRNVIVIGASKGIGAELVTLLAKNQSIQVLALARKIESENKWEAFKNVQVHNFDLQSENLTAELQNILSNVSNVDYVINNA